MNRVRAAAAGILAPMTCLAWCDSNFLSVGGLDKCTRILSCWLGEEREKELDEACWWLKKKKTADQDISMDEENDSNASMLSNGQA